MLDSTWFMFMLNLQWKQNILALNNFQHLSASLYSAWC